MASLINEPNGRRRIQFRGLDGKRCSVRLGKIPKKDAEAILRKIERLISARIAGTALDNETANWLAYTSVELRSKLEAFNLVESQAQAKEPTVETVLSFAKRYVAQKGDMKPASRYLLNQSVEQMTLFLRSIGSEGMPLDKFTRGHAEEFRLWLKSLGLGENTVRRRCGRASQFFRGAILYRLISDNPFMGIKVAVGANESRQFFITQEMAGKVLEACHCAEWRLLFALARYGALRTPSEPLLLKWEHINWEESTMLVTSPKTEHHEGKGARVVPIFRELRPYLDEAWNLSIIDRSEFVIQRYRDAGVNLRSQLQRIIIRAGLAPWPRLWQNLRASRETELAAIYPIQDVTRWCGNTQAIAMRHYLQQTEESFQRAVQCGAQSGAIAGQSGPKWSMDSEQTGIDNSMDSGGLDDFPVYRSGQYRTRTCDLYRVKVAR